MKLLRKLLDSQKELFTKGGKLEKIEPLYVDYDNFTMKLLVHKEFAERLKEHGTKPSG